MTNPNFTTRFRGYDKEQVDQFLQEISQTIHTPEEIYEKTFKTSFRGYDKDAVDTYLNQVIDNLKKEH